MPDCRYCDRTLEDEDAYSRHLADEHADELGPIDRRRIQSGEDGGFDVDVAPLALIAVLGVAAAIVAYVVFLSGSGSSAPGIDAGTTPHGVGSVHYHGTIEMTVDGERVDFTRTEYKHPRENPAFHFEGRDDPRWHVHARDVTLEYAMATLGIGVTTDSVTFQGTTYRDSAADTTVVVEVNGKSVTPSEYVLKQGDSIRIVVRGDE